MFAFTNFRIPVWSSCSALILCILLISGCRKKQQPEPEPEYPFYKILGGETSEGRNWKLEHFYSQYGISDYKSTMTKGYDGVPDHPDWINDNYYTFFNNGYGICHEQGIMNPYADQETAESWDAEQKIYKHIQFDYKGGNTVNIENRVQKPAFFGEWEIISLTESSIVLYQYYKEFDYEMVLVFKRRDAGGI